MLKCLKLYDTVKIDDNSITVTYDGIEQNPERLCARINTALMFARAFGCDVEPAGVSSTIPPESRKMPPASPNDIKVMPQPEPLSKNAPLREEAVRKLVEFCRDLPLLGHNILFDYSFVKHDAVNLGLEFEKEALDTLTVARLALPELESRSLEYLCGYFGICRENAHRAMDDAQETLELYRILEQRYAAEHPEWFRTKPLVCKVKREGPVTRAQIGYLKDLTEYHNLKLDVEIESLTKNEASRMIDTILSTYGRIVRKRNV